MYALITTASLIIGYYIDIVILAVIAGWLVGYGVLDRRNRIVAVITDILYRVTEPALQPIRRLLPRMPGIDFSPLVLVLFLGFLQRFLIDDLLRFVPY